MLPPCTSKCRRECTEHISKAQRESVWSHYWEMEYDRQRDWIVQNVEQKPKLSKTNLAQRSRRSNTIIWNLGSNIVCKTFFLHTLGYMNDNMVFSALRHIKKDGNIVVGT